MSTNDPAGNAGRCIYAPSLFTHEETLRPIAFPHKKTGTLIELLVGSLGTVIRLPHTTISVTGRERSNPRKTLVGGLNAEGRAQANFNEPGGLQHNVQVARLVAAAHLGLDLFDSKLDVHHRNGDKTDNRLANLRILPKRIHQRLHALMKTDGLTEEQAFVEAMLWWDGFNRPDSDAIGEAA